MGVVQELLAEVKNEFVVPVKGKQIPVRRPLWEEVIELRERFNTEVASDRAINTSTASLMLSVMVFELCIPEINTPQEAQQLLLVSGGEAGELNRTVMELTGFATAATGRARDLDTELPIS